MTTKKSKTYLEQLEEKLIELSADIQKDQWKKVIWQYLEIKYRTAIGKILNIIQKAKKE